MSPLSRTRTRSYRLWAAGLVALMTLLIVSLVIPETLAAQSGFGTHEPGRYIYDRAGLLTPDEIADLEQRAQAVVDAGAPVVVFLQQKDADYDETEDDARNLMDTWDIQSAPDAHDGLVFFFNLDPDNPRRGEVALFAGEKHYDGGNLPERELRRIFNDEMRPLLRDDQTARGIAAGLDAAANSLRFGPPPPPPPSQFEQFASDLSEGPISILTLGATLLTAILGFITFRGWQSAPRSSSPIATTTSPPNDLPPALAGALVAGRVNDAQIEGTMLDLARRGALSIEPAGEKKAQIRLLDASVPRTAVERALWASLETRAVDGVIEGSNLAKVRSDWGPAKTALNQELELRGWFDPNASGRRLPGYLAATALLILAIVAFIISIVGQQPWGFVGVTILGLGGLIALIVAYSIPSTTRAGEAEAQPWKSYKAGIKAARSDRLLNVNLNLDTTMPYAVAMGEHRALDRHLKQASESGYDPAWLGPAVGNRHWHGGFYPYWAGLHSSMSPTSSGSGSTGGASSGGGGAGGSF